MNGSQRMAVAGCDTNGGGDIWFTDRQLNNVDNWFSAQSTWSEAEEFVSSQTEIYTPVLVAAPDNQLLALWSQRIGSKSGSCSYSITRSVGETWTSQGQLFDRLRVA
jgi:hypothetical protein